jgi:biotin-(acetyl-CoA carboxylase) ligase
MTDIPAGSLPVDKSQSAPSTKVRGYWGSVWNHQKKLEQDWSHQMPLEFVERYLSNSSQSVDAIRNEWLKRCVHLNRKVTITDGNEIFEGLFEGIGPHGEAIIDKRSVFNGSLRY